MCSDKTISKCLRNVYFFQFENCSQGWKNKHGLLSSGKMWVILTILWRDHFTVSYLWWLEASSNIATRPDAEDFHPHSAANAHTQTAHKLWGGLTKPFLSPRGQEIPGARVKREFQARVRWGVKASGDSGSGCRCQGLGPEDLRREWGSQSEVCIKEGGRGEVMCMKPRRTGPTVNRGLEKPCPPVWESAEKLVILGLYITKN